MNRKLTALAAASLALLALTGCESAADKASRNTSTAAENFEVQREVIVINTRSGETLLQVIGRCSLESGENSSLPGFIEVQCKQGPDDYRKHHVRETPEAFMSSTQLDPIDVDEYRTRWIIKPQNLIPEVEVQLGEQP